MAKVKLTEEDEMIYSFTPQGKAYLEYNEAVGGEPFGECMGMPDLQIEEKYGGVVGLYHECIKQGKTWQELTGWNGHSDEIPLNEE